jgi:hypothetical protein
MNFDINQLIADLSGSEGQEKQASEAPEVNVPNVAEELRSALMTKSASALAGEASDLGRQLAQRLMEKAASEVVAEPEVILGDKLSELAASVQTTLVKEASTVEAQPHLAHQENAELAAAQTQVNANAEQSGGTVESQTTESIQKGLTTPSATATSEDLVDRVEDNMQKAAAVTELVTQGHSFYDAASLVSMADEELQKEAAFHALTEEGYSVDDAVALIKAASEVEESQYEEMDKQAAFQGLLDEGYRFEDAAEMIKEAGLGDLAKGALNTIKAKGGAAVGAVKAEGRNLKDDVSAYKYMKQHSPGDASTVGKARLKGALKRNVIPLSVAGGSLAAGAVTAGVNKAMSKQAALSELLAEGHSFDDAVELVKEASVGSTIKSLANKVADPLRKEVGQLGKDVAKYKSLRKTNPTMAKIRGKHMASNAVKRNKGKLAVAGGTAVAAGAGVAAKKAMTKEAAMSELMNDGYTFNQALAAVQA